MSYDPRMNNKENDELFEAILALETMEECYRFFEDLMTIKELQSVAQRWHVARLLDLKRTYTDIAEETKASAATISRVNKCLSYGADGYSMVLRKLRKEKD
ncbi:MAG: TrpR-like protein YerC/YecD [Firmicutes bacterium]|nr:TrpR-like protein YerC/YecD [Bacillota bacterium]